MKPNTTRLIHPATLLLLFFGLGAASADDDGVIKYRQGIMKAQGGYMGAMGMVVQGRADYSDNMLDHAQGLYKLVKIVPTLFPAGTDFGETDALEKIWDSKDDFEAKAGDAERAASDLVTAAQSGNIANIIQAYKAVGQSCKACHEEYRRKK